MFGSRNPNLQVAITHVQHVCSQRSLALPQRMNGMHRTQSDHVRLDLLSLDRYLITHVLTINHVKHTQRTHHSVGAKAF